MLSQVVRDQLNKCNDWVSAKNKMGDILHKDFNVVKGNYKFSRDGGAISDINLKDQDGLNVVKLPSGAIVLNVFVHVPVALTSAGLATVDLNVEAANDALAAGAVASFSLGAKIQGIPDFGTLSDALVLTAERTLTMSINAFALTAGEFNAYYFYVFPS